MFLVSRARLVRQADTLPPSMSRPSGQWGILNISQHSTPPRLVMVIASLLLCLVIYTSLETENIAISISILLISAVTAKNYWLIYWFRRKSNVYIQILLRVITVTWRWWVLVRVGVADKTSSTRETRAIRCLLSWVTWCNFYSEFFKRHFISRTKRDVELRVAIPAWARRPSLNERCPSQARI
jgi:hypothetical protein